MFEDKDIVLVRGNEQDVRNAFRSYFSDASDFLLYMDEAISDLSGHNIPASIEDVEA